MTFFQNALKELGEACQEYKNAIDTQIDSLINSNLRDKVINSAMTLIIGRDWTDNSTRSNNSDELQEAIDHYMHLINKRKSI